MPLRVPSRERPALRDPGSGPAPALCWGCERPRLLHTPCANLRIAPAGPHVLGKAVVRHRPGRPGEYGRHLNKSSVELSCRRARPGRPLPSPPLLTLPDWVNSSHSSHRQAGTSRSGHRWG
ncbi:hypothetical protein NDU88_007158 [Pleurodeles waltl]|uniref:Uncharacterized protein n=1 Tax=Pleurodeles waltl TaxID=8319 RepID=A0AAV7WG43_PLEWA|nr:hypothetical protein NDU88_007158 [Pleurodeles waltl]